MPNLDGTHPTKTPEVKGSTSGIVGMCGTVHCTINTATPTATRCAPVFRLLPSGLYRRRRNLTELLRACRVATSLPLPTHPLAGLLTRSPATRGSHRPSDHRRSGIGPQPSPCPEGHLCDCALSIVRRARAVKWGCLQKLAVCPPLPGRGRAFGMQRTSHGPFPEVAGARYERDRFSRS